MYNSRKFKWLPLQPGTERFILKHGPIGNFDVSSLTPKETAIFLRTTATVAENGLKLRTLYVWESDTDRQVYMGAPTFEWVSQDAHRDTGFSPWGFGASPCAYYFTPPWRGPRRASGFGIPHSAFRNGRITSVRLR